jgi:cellulose synthase/poly-beta-1,6-N-acetylglucosamine synthase-like glycosyltransferase
MVLLFGGAVAVLLLYALLLRLGWRRGHRPSPPVPDAPPPLSVVVAARNEANTLPSLLAALDAQTHPDYEVVIVDDASTDATAAVAADWARDRSFARVVSLSEPHSPRKKHALSRGIDAASHDLLAFTDADCTPPPDWLSVLGAHHAAAPTDRVLVGYAPLTGTGLLGRFARYEALVEALYTTAAIGWSRPYMATGRNLSYPRSVFEGVGGFGSIDGSMSGDDDLFVQTVHRRGAAEVRAVHAPRSFVPSPAPSTWSAWARQRRRHASAGRQYAWTAGLHLTLLHTSLVLLWAAPLALGDLGLGLLATGLLARHAALGPAADALDETPLLALFPLWEAGLALYHLLLVPLGLLVPPARW